MSSLNVLDMGIDTHQEPVVYMREDCHVCRAEGFSANTRIAVSFNAHTIIATLNIVQSHVLLESQIGFSNIALQRLNVSAGDCVQIDHAPVVESLSFVRKKIFGHALNQYEIQSIISDISIHRYTDIEIASFLSVCAGNRLSIDEIIGLTRAMVNCGKRLDWPGHNKVFDKHCIGGLPGNRTSPLVVAIVSAAGLIIPKTSSRAITSPAGTADTMEALMNVNLDLKEIRKVVDKTGACLVWGGAVNLSPADDVLIRIERALDLDGEGQLIASVLSKKIAAGSTHAVIDIPVGETAKVRTKEKAEHLASLFTQVGEACGIYIRCVLTDGSKPVGFGIGPAEEARDILSVLNNETGSPKDLRERSLILAAHLFDLENNKGIDFNLKKANSLLDSGLALEQFNKIADAQGGFKVLPHAKYSHVELAYKSGVLLAIDNRRLARLAKLAGAPTDIAAGLRLHVQVGKRLKLGEKLFSLFSDSSGERDYALEYYKNNPDIFSIGD